MSSAVSECGGRGQLAGPQLYSRIPGGERGKMVMMMVMMVVMVVAMMTAMMTAMEMMMIVAETIMLSSSRNRKNYVT